MPRRLLREPLIHFLLLGAALFALFELLDARDRDASRESGSIVVGAGQIEHLATVFTRTWDRAPTSDELKGLVDEHVEEEILSREAVKLGLDRDDTVIRRRLRQKMRFLLEDFSASADPTDDALAGFYERHAEEYREPGRISFQQIFLNAERTEQVALALLDRLRSGAFDVDPFELGDRTLLPYSYEDESSRAVAAQFGNGFAVALLRAPDVGSWFGPVRSEYGTHLVRLSSREPGRLPALEDVREDVRRDLMSERRREFQRAALERLLEQYDVVIEWPTESEASR